MHHVYLDSLMNKLLFLKKEKTPSKAIIELVKHEETWTDIDA